MKRIICFTILITAFINQNSFTAKPTPIQDEESRKEIAQKLLDNILEEKYDNMRANFSGQLKEQLPVEKLEGIWKQLVDAEGPYQKTLSMNTLVTQGFNQVLIRCAFKNDNLTLEVTFSRDDKIIGVFWKP